MRAGAGASRALLHALRACKRARSPPRPYACACACDGRRLCCRFAHSLYSLASGLSGRSACFRAGRSYGAACASSVLPGHGSHPFLFLSRSPLRHERWVPVIPTTAASGVPLACSDTTHAAVAGITDTHLSHSNVITNQFARLHDIGFRMRFVHIERRQQEGECAHRISFFS